MEISELQKIRLRNDEHFMLHTEFHELLSRTGAENLRVATQFANYTVLLSREDEGLKKITKSALTARIHDEDKVRDELYDGMTELNAALIKSPHENKREAAKRLKIVFDTYGNISKKPINEQTSAVINILQELKGPYATDAQLLGLTDYITLIETHNNTLEALVRERYDESAAKTDVVIRAARLALDASYDDITARINALALLEGGTVVETFIRTLNTILAKYSAILNARLGRRHHKPHAGENAGNNVENESGSQEEQTEEEDS